MNVQRTNTSSHVSLNPNERGSMIMEFLPLVKSVATRLASRFPSHVDVDDLINIGSLGLIEAIDRFDPLRCESFKAYAELRIRGAILDEIRVQDWMPRSVRHRVQELERARRRLLNRLGRAPSEREVADEMGLALEDVQAIQQSAANQSMLSLDELGVRDDSRRDIHEVIPGDSEDALTMLVGRCNTERLAQAIGALPDREKDVVSLYYYEGLMFREIGDVIGVSESRISQIHNQAITRLKLKLKKLAVEAY